MKSLDFDFYAFFVISLLLLALSAIVLLRSFNKLNQLFVSTPLLFVLILALNMLDYFSDVSPFLLYLPYLLAPIGVALSAEYILYDVDYLKDRRFVFALLGYVFASLLLSVGIEASSQAVDTSQVSNLSGIAHFLMGGSLLLAALLYYRVSGRLGDLRTRILILVSGLVIVVVSTWVRGVSYLVNGDDYRVAFVFIILGVVVVILSFLRIGISAVKESSPASV